MNRDRIQEAFAAYTEKYDPSDKKIRLKIDHTYRVAGFCDRIAHSLGLSEEECTLVWTMGVLHDVGRFEQIRRYQTFNDAQSVNHAEFGADLLFTEGQIREFLPEYVDKVADPENREEIRILKRIELAIRQHNRLTLTPGLTSEEEMYCNILRDADKIDIFRVHSETPAEVIYGMDEEQMAQAEITPAVYEVFMGGRCIDKTIRRTAADIMVSHLALAFELVFPESRRTVDEQGYLGEMLKFSSKNPEAERMLVNMREKMRDFLAQEGESPV